MKEQHALFSVDHFFVEILIEKSNKIPLVLIFNSASGKQWE